MVSSKKPNEKTVKSDGVNKAGGQNIRSSGSKTKETPNKVKIAKKELEVYEISESSSSDSVEEAIRRGDGPKKSNGVVSKGRNRKVRGVPTNRSKNREEDEGVLEDAKMFRFPMNRIRRIMRSDNSAPQIMQDAVFLVNKVTEMFIERFSEEAYESSAQDRKKFIHYKHLSSVVSNEERYEFLADCVPEKLKAEVALEEWERGMTDADYGKILTPPPTVWSFAMASPTTVDGSTGASRTTRSTPVRSVRMSPGAQSLRLPQRKGEGDFPNPMSLEAAIEGFGHLGGIQTSHIQVIETASKLGGNVTVSQVGSDLPTNGTATTAFPVDRTKGWQPSYSLDEDALLHQLRANLVQAIDASMQKLRTENQQFQQQTTATASGPDPRHAGMR